MSVQTQEITKHSARIKMKTYRVLLYNDHFNLFFFVVKAIQDVFKCTKADAIDLTFAAHYRGSVKCQGGLIFEIAELRRDQMLSFGLSAAIEPEL